MSIIDRKAKNILLAHNQHVKKQGHTTGNWLHKKLGKEYVNIGILEGKGTHYTNDNYKEKHVHEMPPTLPNSYKYILNKVCKNPFVLNMKDIISNEDLQSQFGPRVMSTAGAVSQLSKLSHRVVDLANEFDYIIYFPEVNPMNLIDYD
jgi:erythromycin esterase-like protein